MKIPIVKLKNFFRVAIKKIKSFPLLVAKNIFPSFLELFLIVIIIGVSVYYYYGVLAKVNGEQAEIEVPQLDRTALRSVLRQMDAKDSRLIEAETALYPDPFNPIIPSNLEIVDQ